MHIPTGGKMNSNFQIADPNLDNFQSYSLNLEFAIANGDTADAQITFHVFKGTGIQELVKKTIRKVIAEYCKTWDDFSQVKHDIALLTRTEFSKSAEPVVINQLTKMAKEYDAEYPFIIHPDDIVIREKEGIAA